MFAIYCKMVVWTPFFSILGREVVTFEVIVSKLKIIF